jgi:hypothetical protein
MRAGRPGADWMTAGRMTAGRTTGRPYPATGGAAGPPRPAWSPAARVTFTPIAVLSLAGVGRGLRRTRRPIAAGGATVPLPGAQRRARRRPVTWRKATWPGEPAHWPAASSPAAATSWTGTRTMTTNATATPGAAAGGVACSAGADAKPIQNPITTPGAGIQGAHPPGRPARPGPGEERGRGGRLRVHPQRRLAMRSHPAVRFRGTVRFRPAVHFHMEAGFRGALRFRPAVRFRAAAGTPLGIRFPPAARVRVAIRCRVGTQFRLVGRSWGAARSRQVSWGRVAVRSRPAGRGRPVARSRPGSRGWTAT